MPLGSGRNPANNFLDIYDDWVKVYVSGTISKFGIKYKQIEPNIEPCIEKAKRDYGNRYISEFDNPIKARLDIANVAIGYLQMIVSQKEKFRKAKGQIRTFGAFTLIGAGVSYSSEVPLSKELQTILSFCRAESYLGLRADNSKFMCFKKSFKEICLRKSPNLGHLLIAKNFPRYVREIVTLNWDNLIERAIRKEQRRFSLINTDDVTPNDNNIWKFHGDVELIKEEDTPGRGGWILPGENGYVFGSFDRHFESSFLGRELYVLLIVGYSENDSEVNSKVINKIYENGKRPLYTVSMNLELLKNDDVLVGSSDYVLAHILPIV